MAKILIVEDSLEHQKLIKVALDASHEIHFLSDANAILKDVKKLLPDLIIMDVNLPTTNGLQACTFLQDDTSTNEIPLLFLSAKRDTADIILGLSVGADDYIVKPFEPLELRARVEAKLKKASRQSSKDALLVRGDLKLSPLSQQVVLKEGSAEKSLSLTPIEFRLLFYLAKHEGHVLSRDQIMTGVWGDESIDLTDRSVDTHISSIRKKCLKAGKYIESIYGVGYRFDSKTSSRSSA